MKILVAFVVGILTVFSGMTDVSAESSTVTRYEGRSRENVAENVAQQEFSNSNKVIVVNRDKFSDAISATNISQGRYPVLYTYHNKVSDSTLKQIISMSLDEIYVMGGELSVNESVVNQLKKASGAVVTRITGRSRYDANVESVDREFSNAPHVVIASGEVYPDALYGVSYANTINAPLILTKTNAFENSTVLLLKELGVKKATIVGGTLTVTPNVENHLKNMGISTTRIAGQNRYEGSAEVAEAAYDNPANIVVASGEVFTDALVSAPLSQKLNAPILLVKQNNMEDDVTNYVVDNSTSINNVYIQGGELTISNTIENRLNVLTTNEAFDVVAFNRAILNLINAERAKVGVHALTYNPALQAGANVRTNEIIQKFSHTRPNGKDAHTAFEYVYGSNSIYNIGENIAQNYIETSVLQQLQQTPGALEKRLAQDFYNQYYNSSGHYRNMINDIYNSMAVGFVPVDQGMFTYTYDAMILSVGK